MKRLGAAALIVVTMVVSTPMASASTIGGQDPEEWEGGVVWTFGRMMNVICAGQFIAYVCDTYNGEPGLGRNFLPTLPVRPCQDVTPWNQTPIPAGPGCAYSLNRMVNDTASAEWALRNATVPMVMRWTEPARDWVEEQR